MEMYNIVHVMLNLMWKTLNWEKISIIKIAPQKQTVKVNL